MGRSLQPFHKPGLPEKMRASKERPAGGSAPAAWCQGTASGAGTAREGLCRWGGRHCLCSFPGVKLGEGRGLLVSRQVARGLTHAEARLERLVTAPWPWWPAHGGREGCVGFPCAPKSREAAGQIPGSKEVASGHR